MAFPPSHQPPRQRLCYICEATEGGVRKHLMFLLQAFVRAEEGFAVTALLGNRGEPGFEKDLDELRELGAVIEIVPGLHREIRPGRDWSALRFLKRRLREQPQDVVHTHSSKAGVLGRLAAHAAGVPRILHTPHVFPFQWSRGAKGAFYLALERYVARRCHRIVCVGPGQKEEALARRVAPAEKLDVIANGIAPLGLPTPSQRKAARKELGVPEGSPVVGMISRMAPQKDVETFLVAAARTRLVLPEAVFVLVGGGPLEQRMRARAAELGLTNEALKMTGFVEHAARFLPAFDLAVLTSRYEGLPFSLLEAMGVGLPVVATRVAGTVDVIVHEHCGILVSPGAPDELAGQIVKLLRDEAKRARLGKAARQRVQEHFGLDRFLDEHRRLYGGRLAQAFRPEPAPQVKVGR